MNSNQLLQDTIDISRLIGNCSRSHRRSTVRHRGVEAFHLCAGRGRKSIVIGPIIIISIVTTKIDTVALLIHYLDFPPQLKLFPQFGPSLIDRIPPLLLKELSPGREMATNSSDRGIEKAR